MGTDMLAIGISGLHAAQLGLQVTQHNIANANTEGYNRQSLLQSASAPVASGAGYFGTGASVDTVVRSYDKYITKQIYSAQSQASSAEVAAGKLSQIDNLLGDASVGLSSAMTEFFDGVQRVAANPSLISARQSMISASQSLVGRFNTLGQQLAEMQEGVNSQVVSEVAAINGYAAQLADVNATITQAVASSTNVPNDLLDRRDQLVAELSKHIKVSAVDDGNGAFNVFIGKGQQLVIGNTANQLQAMASSQDPERVVVGLKGPSGVVQELSEDLVDGGTLGGLMSFRANSLDGAANTLGALAASVALTFNAQHALGQDLNGLNATSGAASGFQADYFQVDAPRVIPHSDVVATPATVTASFLAPSVDAATGGFFTKLSGSDYNLRFDGANYTLTRLSDNTTWSDASISALNGKITGEGISIAGAPTANVDYLIEPTTTGALNMKLNSAIAVDPRSIAVAAPVVTRLGMQNKGSLSATQGSVSTGYSLSKLSSASPATPTFSYDATNGRFSVPVGASAVVMQARYSDGSTQQISVPAGGTGLVNWKNTAVPQATLSGIDYDVTLDGLGNVVGKGISVELSGTPANNDTFSIATNTNGSSDSRNAVKLAALQVQNTMESGKASFQSYYASLVGKVGAETKQAQSVTSSQQALLKQSSDVRQSISGVNLDEEAANLIKYQQAYQAAAKALEIASKLFDSLLSIKS